MPEAEQPTTPQPPASTIANTPESADRLVVTQHSITINGQLVSYTVTAGTLVLKDEVEEEKKEGQTPSCEKAKAAVFFIAYTRNDVPDAASRPVTFSFNGGPGSSSVWLHLGVLGPRRVVLDSDGRPLPPPYRLTDNEYSLLDCSDLVFIDPVSTGYSRPMPGEKSREFHGFKRDIESVGDFIRLYITRYQRWGSPKFLAGESYGTIRAAGLAGYLQERYGMYLNGLMLISSVLDFQTVSFGPPNDLPYLLFLPTYAATAWYHGKLNDDLQGRPLDDLLREVEGFAIGEYALALLRGATLNPDEQGAIAAQVARYTGLSQEYVRRSNLRIDILRFAKELMRAEGRTVGRLDSRFTGMDRDGVGERFEYDPSMADTTGPFTATMNDYVRRELGFQSDLPYEILNPKVWPWNYSDFENRYVATAETLRRSMTINPYLKVFVASGYYDLGTPHFAADYTFHHLGLNPALQGNITMKYYEAGHMMYIHQPSLVAMKQDLAKFVQAGIGGGS
ncbi:MAG: peptidase S10 [Armatimonadetes bacterium]|nr:peptidase S10 [Armatimonadota bacterium]